jgi:hypothetical protein
LAKSQVAAPVADETEDEISQPTYVTPEGKLTLTLIEAEINLPGYKPGTKSAKLKFEVQDDEWATEDEETGETKRPVIQALVSQTLGVSKAMGPSNLRRLVVGLLGRDLELVENEETGRKEPEKVRLSTLYGKSITAQVNADEKSDGRVFPKIDFKTVKKVK